MLLLDTHIWIRWHNPQSGRFALAENLIEEIETADSIAISAISCLAIALEGDIQVLPVDRPIAIKASQLPEHHRDPADRIIIATALIHEASLVSLDSVFPQYEELKDRLITG
ncbi:MAG: type II toxin-antitoxin system VapC family toxin [Limnospira sp. PMC 1291.21]|uniref:PIN domain-containing protein n=2 Tax=Limnospira TaxID=2596745 RepID=A0A9P1NXA5_9CYAN|nr:MULTISPECIES: type II toxin-antitoxin system VapC family toxin [Limnospira]EKD09907.1 hypothetical protein SPLC1_S131440 [Arthrospira platensis C1]MDC0838093.1 type II toxin-antitoxin system VapC family toxin [Limnoraphis robusta]RAQ40784.1 PIN domain-containing protein [Arthrospira sp. O9.13F]EDZ92869.1 PilT protein domain protein [Limnospira maxima CS-328]MDT9180689.1 type II toxin-antitoxin system VapC family toxin [Limnospira sp. PMC 1238.20]